MGQESLNLCFSKNTKREFFGYKALKRLRKALSTNWPDPIRRPGNPLGGGAALISNFKLILKLKITDLFAIHFLKKYKKELYRVLCKMQETQALFGGAYKYYHLSQLLDEYKPGRILELGSGYSTGVFALYCKENKSTGCTFEHSPKWQKNTIEKLGELSEYMEIKLVDYAEEGGFPSKTYYRESPEGDVDFVYVDGPPLTKNGKVDVDVVNWDVVRLIETGRMPRVIVIDIRLATAQYLFENYKHLYAYFSRQSKKRFTHYRYHHVFVLKDKK